MAAEEGSRPESSGRPETAVAQPRTADLGYSTSASGFGERLGEASTAEEFAGAVRAGGGSRPIPERNETLSNENEDPHAEIGGGGGTTSSHPTLATFPSTTSSLGLAAPRVGSPSGGEEAGTRRVSFEEELASSGLLERVEELDTISEGGVVVEGGEGMVRTVKEGGEAAASGEDGEGSTGGSSSGA